MTDTSELIFYQTDDGNSKIEVKLEGDTVWLSQDQMAELFQKDKSTISRHIKNIFEEKELVKESVVAKNATTASDGKVYQVDYYNLDVIISVGYRVKSVRGTQFRIWANSILKEYIIKGFALNDEQMKEMGGGNYWKELLQRIRDIRSSEKVFWRQVLDIYATSIDYDPDSKESLLFFKTVQNKIHYAAHGNTAAETIYYRIDASKNNLGLTSFKGNHPTKEEAKIAKNYLEYEELQRLNTMVSAFFDLAELKAQQHKQMFMKDWIEELDKFCGLYGQGVLKNAGKVSHKRAIQKVEEEYLSYKAAIDALPSGVEESYLGSIKKIKEIVKK